jgi:hypothetical protein
MNLKAKENQLVNSNDFEFINFYKRTIEALISKHSCGMLTTDQFVKKLEKLAKSKSFEFRVIRRTRPI